MSEWDFLYDMNAQGYSMDEILDAMASGASPEEWNEIERQEKKQNGKNLNLYEILERSLVKSSKKKDGVISVEPKA